jgi:hypothetical protein
LLLKIPLTLVEFAQKELRLQVQEQQRVGQQLVLLSLPPESISVTNKPQILGKEMHFYI